MEFNKINFAVLEECLLAAESKEFLQSVFFSLPSHALDSELATIDSDNLPACIRSLPSTLGVSNEKAFTVTNRLSLHVYRWCNRCITWWKSTSGLQWWTRIFSLQSSLQLSRSNWRPFFSRWWERLHQQPKSTFRMNSRDYPNSETSIGEWMWRLLVNSKNAWSKLCSTWN